MKQQCEQAKIQNLSKFEALEALKNIKMFLQQWENSAEALLAATSVEKFILMKTTANLRQGLLTDYFKED